MSSLRSPEVRVMFGPATAYQELLEESRDEGAWVLLRRPLIVALILGGVVSFSTTGRLTLRLFLGAAVCWSFVPGLQMAAAAVLIALGRRRPIPGSRAIDLFFMGHAPWSLWLLAVAAAGALSLPEGTHFWTMGTAILVFLSALVVAGWTGAILRAYCRTVLGMSPPRARTGTLLYQAIIWGFAVTYVFIVTQLWPRLVGLMPS